MENILEFLDKVVVFFNMSEKDIVMWAFLGCCLIAMFITWAVEDTVAFVKAHEGDYSLEVEYVKRIILAPILSLILRANGVSPGKRKKRVASFIYDD